MQWVCFLQDVGSMHTHTRYLVWWCQSNNLRRRSRYGGQIGATGARFIAQCIPVKALSHLTHLSLANQRIGDTGTRYLARALARLNTKDKAKLWYVDLRSNAITDEGGEALARMLETNQTVRTLCVDANRLTDVGFVAFGNSVVVNTALTFLSLLHNPATDVGLECLRAATLKRFEHPILIQPKGVKESKTKET